jgi:predicted 3-demethylubiquinone-9 3-methyltransferase (glyoxalase superfamily)
LKDRFGVSWQVVPKVLAQMMADPNVVPKVIAALSQMRKFEMEKLY